MGDARKSTGRERTPPDRDCRPVARQVGSRVPRHYRRVRPADRAAIALRARTAGQSVLQSLSLTDQMLTDCSITRKLSHASPSSPPLLVHWLSLLRRFRPEPDDLQPLPAVPPPPPEMAPFDAAGTRGDDHQARGEHRRGAPDQRQALPDQGHAGTRRSLLPDRPERRRQLQPRRRWELPDVSRADLWVIGTF
jgi:hypothetical protein